MHIVPPHFESVLCVFGQRFSNRLFQPAAFRRDFWLAKRRLQEVGNARVLRGCWLIAYSIFQKLESRGPDSPVPPLAAECSLGQLVILEPVALRQSQRNAAAGSLPAIHQNPGKMIMLRMLHVGN